MCEQLNKKKNTFRYDVKVKQTNTISLFFVEFIRYSNIIFGIPINVDCSAITTKIIFCVIIALKQFDFKLKCPVTTATK